MSGFSVIIKHKRNPVALSMGAVFILHGISNIYEGTGITNHNMHKIFIIKFLVIIHLSFLG